MLRVIFFALVCMLYCNITEAQELPVSPSPGPLSFPTAVGQPVVVELKPVPEYIADYLLTSEVDMRESFRKHLEDLKQLEQLSVPKETDDEIVKIQRARLKTALLLKQIYDDKIQAHVDGSLEDVFSATQRICEAASELVATRNEKIWIYTLARDTARHQEVLARTRSGMGTGPPDAVLLDRCRVLDTELRLAKARTENPPNQ